MPSVRWISSADADQLLGLGVAALLDQDAGQAHDEARRRGIVFALVLQPRQQRAARIGLGLGEPALLRLHARGVKAVHIGGLADLGFRRRGNHDLRVIETRRDLALGRFV